MAKVAALMVVTLLGLLGSVPCQGSTADQTIPVANPLIPDVSRPPPSGLTVGYYNDKCPAAEDTVKQVVEKAMAGGNRGIGAVLVRLFFHDCFVRGCDGSVLLKNTSGSSQETEMFGSPNIDLLSGFQVIEDAKTELENNQACSGKVSCADIVAFAARDAVRSLSSGAIDIKMPAGRLDGRVSLKGEAENNLPSPSSTLKDLEKSFTAHDLDFNDLMTLSGAHSIGKARCEFFTNRLPPNPSDMDRDFANSLNVICKRNGGEFRVVQDSVTALVLDNQYYTNVQSHKVLFTSDAALYSSGDVRKVVDGFAKNGTEWNLAFAKAMVKMGEIRDKTLGAPKPEIRKKCWIYNTQ